jgi:hypothetical protein
MSSSEKATRRRHFYIKRQQFIDEIMFDHGSKAVRALTALERNVGIMITKSINPDTGETFEHASSFAKRLGGKTKVRHVEDALKVLEAPDWSRIEQVAAVIGRGWTIARSRHQRASQPLAYRVREAPTPSPSAPSSVPHGGVPAAGRPLRRS